MPQYIGPQPRNGLLGVIADVLGSAKRGTGLLGDVIFGGAPEMLDRASYGQSPVTFGGTSNGLLGAIYGMRVDPGVADVASLLGAAPGVGRSARFAGREALRAVDDAMLGSGPARGLLSAVRPAQMLPSDARKLPPAYYRNNHSNVTPDNDVPWSMYADDAGSVEHYGPVGWVFDPHSMSAREILDARTQSSQRRIRAALGRDPDVVASTGQTATSLAREANPESIVNSAGLWDNPDLVQSIWNNLLEPGGYRAVITNDGALTFDPELARLLSKAK